MGTKEILPFSPQLEQAIADYPQIGWAKILTNPTETFLGPNGNIIEFSLKQLSEIKIKGSFLDKIFWMKSELIDDYLEFEIVTKQDLNGETVVRHPDMFGAKFIAIAVAYFEQKQPINGLKGTWLGGSQNFEMFWEAVDCGKTKEQAALNTWSGKVFAKLGFNQVSQVEHQPEIIRSSFKRPQFLH